MKKFEFYEQYLEQDNGIRAARKKYEDKVKAAEQEVEAAKVKLDEIVHAEISSGADKDKEKRVARAAIEQAEKNVQHAKDEQVAASRYFIGKGGSITRPQVVKTYLKEYVPSVREEQLPLIKERIKKGQDLILSAIHDFNQLKIEYKKITDDIRVVNEGAVRIDGEVSYWIPNPFEDIENQAFSAYKFNGHLRDVILGEELPAETTYYKEAK